MSYRLLANAVLLFHFGWILFMLAGFALTIAGLRRKCWLDERWLFRTVHLAGILFVAFFAITGHPCPVTTLEVWLLRRHDPALGYEGSCLAHYLQQLIYPGFDPTLIVDATFALALFTVIVYVVRPPARVRALFSR